MIRAAAFALLLAAMPLQAREWPQVTFGAEVFDVTGAGTLYLGPLDPVLRPFRKSFGGFDGFAVSLTLDRAGTVIGCTPDQPDDHPEAAKALCAHALKVGRFRRDPVIAIDYDKATYRLYVFHSDKSRSPRGEEFTESPTYPLGGTAVIFGGAPIPPDAERLTFADVIYTPMDYPRDALRSAVEARVVVALSFDAAGKVATCRPIQSTNTARIAYDTCREAQRHVRLRTAPDPRVFVLATNWALEE